jgi:putative lipoic acid-binding regulatory protein
MKDNKETTEETLKIPSDMLIDILGIIVKEELKHEIIEVIQNRSLVVITVWHEKNSARTGKVIENIKNLLLDYEHFRSSENEELNWRDN